ncbi:MAG TPA: ANTAR domain-containing protein [Bryobacteraceae bacterium]|jgi:hypothetical protein
MTAGRFHMASAMDSCLEEALSVLNGAATAMGAGSVAVVLAENSASIRLVYQWPDTDSQVKGEAPADFGGKGRQAASLPQAAIEQFLKERFGSATNSFVLVPWPSECTRIAIAFGFASAEAGRLAIPNETSATLRLAALTAWMSFEARRLRRDLTVVSERLGQRKIVERAKGLLQAQNEWTEPQAYEHLRKLSRQRRKPMAEVAQAVLRTPQGSG